MARADERAHLGGVEARVLHAYAENRGLEQRQELVEDRALHEDARPRAAVLTCVVEDAVRRGRSRLGEVCVGEDHVGALATELERDRLNLSRAALGDVDPDLGRAGEDDLGDVRARDEPLADDRALAGEDLEHALGKSGLEAELTEAHRGHRRELGRLQHDGVAGGECGGEAPTGDRHREVPGHDHPDDTERLMEGDVDSPSHRDLVTEHPLGRARVVGKDVAHVPRLPAGVADRVAGVAHLELRELLVVLVDELRELPQDARSITRRDAPPRLERRLRPRDGDVGLLQGERGHRRDDLLGDGADDVVQRGHARILFSQCHSLAAKVVDAYRPLSSVL